KNLNDKAKQRDPEKRGLNFLINPNVDAPRQVATTTAVDPTTGQPVTTSTPVEPVDLSTISIKINPPLTDIRLADALDAIVK
ncbi:hypothetical protein ACXWOS_10625, partial [Streptococcus pyogenes]